MKPENIILSFGAPVASGEAQPVKVAYCVEPVEPTEPTHYVAMRPDGSIHGQVQDNVGDREVIAAMVSVWIRANLVVDRMTEKELARYRRALAKAQEPAGQEPATPASPEQSGGTAQ